MTTSRTSLTTKASLEQMIINTIMRHARPKRIILFGSRAREDAQERSDYDIALDDEQMTRTALAHLRAEIEELPTLLHIDVVWLNRAATALRERILSEGKILYEQQS
ncbi:MAG: nucleotidyltransferase domain-containing protein [candidate division KSB1 bacterium]